jgi:hypothetical protein
MPPKRALFFPEHGDPHFARKLAQLEEYRIFAAPAVEPIADAAAYEGKVQEACGGFEKAMYQHMVAHYLSRRSPYRSLLLFHGLGVGKTCSSITLAESMLLDHKSDMPPKILVVSPLALKKSYEDQVFSAALFLSDDPDAVRNQCTADTYKRLIHGDPPKDLFLKRVHQLIRARYQFLTYDGLVEYVAQNPIVSDMTVIVDEAHNLRNQETEKRAADALEKLVQKGKRNRLVLLSATPMYNEPDELLWLLQLLLWNDKRTAIKLPKTLFSRDGDPDPAAEATLRQVAQEYVSYIRGKNPFTFAPRIHPSVSEVPVLREPWAASIEDGLVPTPIGAKQKDGGVVAEARAGSSPKQLQWLNITYPGSSHGEKGFDKMFDHVGEPFPVTYRPGHKDALMPLEGALKDCAAKLDRICSLVKEAQGIVMVYSQFVWSGVVPLAIALEHMGFRRYGGADLLQRPTLVREPVSYPGVAVPHYCILSGDAGVMGTSKMEALRKVINAADNAHGERIKMVLITPVAGEGLSFRNVREVHIMDPWYHMNRIEQVVGRAIRTCSHVQLPLEERNVTVFLHCATVEGRDTADVHAYRIAARKWRQTKRIEAVVRDHALDCATQKHLNYIPEDVFGFEAQMRTSQGRVFSHRFGDDAAQRPACDAMANTPGDASTLRPDAYAALLPTVLRRLEKYVRRRLGERVFFTLAELVSAARVKEDLVVSALEQIVTPQSWLPTHDAFVHRNGVVFVAKQASPPQTVVPIPAARIRPERPSGLEEKADVAEDLLRAVPAHPDTTTRTLLLYQWLDSNTWPTIAAHILQHQEDPIVKPFASMLATTGALITRRELPKALGAKTYVGYVAIFEKSESDFKAYVMREDGSLQVATPNEVRTILNKRTRWAAPTQDVLWGILEPTRFSKAAPGAPLRMTLKVMPPGPSVGKKRGVVCSSNKKKELQDWLAALRAPSENGDTKDQMCFRLALALLRAGRLLLYPEYKPT